MAQIPIKIYGGAKKPLQVIFTSSQTYTIPSGYKSMDVFVVGGGGGGGASEGRTTGQSSSVELHAGGGGGGGYTQTYKKVTISQKNISITIGGGGAKGTTKYQTATSWYLITNTVGGDGGKTSVIVGANEYFANGGYGSKFKGATSPSNSEWSNSGGTGGASAANYYAGGSGTGHANGLSAGSDGANGSAYNSGKPRWYVGQGLTTKAFGEDNGTVYAGGGKGGNTVRYYSKASTTFGYGGAGGTGRGTNMGGGGEGLEAFGEMSGVGSSGGSNGDAGKAIIRLYPKDKRPEITWDSSNTISL